MRAMSGSHGTQRTPRSRRGFWHSRMAAKPEALLSVAPQRRELARKDGSVRARASKYSLCSRTDDDVLSRSFQDGQHGHGARGYWHKTVCHGRGEYGRDEDGDGFCEVHVNTIEGFWSLLRSWLRPHRGISQDKLPLYLGFFQFVHNARRRGKALLGAFIAGLVA